MLKKAKTVGMFVSNSSSLKWVSILWAPSKSASKFSYPTDKLMLNPTALQSEKRPPTQSHIGKMLEGSMPKACTFAVLVDTATKCLATSS